MLARTFDFRGKQMQHLNRIIMEAHMVPSLSESSVRGTIIMRYNSPCYIVNAIKHLFETEQFWDIAWLTQTPESNPDGNLWNIRENFILKKPKK